MQYLRQRVHEGMMPRRTSEKSADDVRALAAATVANLRKLSLAMRGHHWSALTGGRSTARRGGQLVTREVGHAATRAIKAFGRRLRRDGPAVAADSPHRAPLRRQSRAARSPRSDPHRGRFPLWRKWTRPRVSCRTQRGQTEAPVCPIACGARRLFCRGSLRRCARVEPAH